MIHWLIVNVYPTALRTAVGAVTAALIAGLVIQPFKKTICAIRRAVDSVDPETDTGITKQLSDLNRRLPARTDHAPVVPHRR